MKDILDLVQWTPPVLLVVALNVLGRALKASEVVPNRLIPLILPIVGSVVYTGLGSAVPLPYVALLRHPWIIYAVIGFIAGGVAVWGHQLVTNLVNRKKENQ